MPLQVVSEMVLRILKQGVVRTFRRGDFMALRKPGSGR